MIFDYITKSKNEGGFSIVETIIASAIMAGAALSISKFQASASQNITKLRSQSLSISLERKIASVLAQKENCTATLRGRAIGDSIDNIRDTQSNIILRQDQSFLQNRVLVKNIASELIGNHRDNQQKIRLNIVLGQREFNRDVKDVSLSIPLVVRTDLGAITECTTVLDELIELACQSKSGLWDGANCSLPACDNGDLLSGFDEEGRAVCRTISCPNNTFYRGLNSTGNPICEEPLAGGTCTGGRVVSSLDSRGRPVCTM